VRALGFACVAVLPLLALDWPRVAESWVGLPVARSSRSSSARRAVELTRRASEREEAGDAPGALALYAAAAEAVPDRVWPALVLENALVRHGRCAEARGLDETVRARLWREPEMRQAAEATRALLAVCRTGSSP
jgi:hypothetical protein